MNCQIIFLSIFLISFTILASADDLTTSPAKSKLGRKNSFTTVFTVGRQRRDRWTGGAIRKLIRERNLKERTTLVPLEYDGAPLIDIIFKDESTLPGGSHFRTIWILFMKYLKAGMIRPETHLVDGSFGGNSAIATAHFARLLGLRLTIFVPIEMAPEKLTKIISLGARVIRAHPILLIFRPKEEAARIPNGFYLNSPGSFSEFSPFDDPKINVYDEFLDQLATDENITSIDLFVSTVSTGATINSISSAVARRNAKTKIIAVDTQFSGIYDFLINNRYTANSSWTAWRNPGIPEAGAGPPAPFVTGSTTSLRPDTIDQIVKLPDLAIVAALSILNEKGINGGPSTAANFLASLVIASSETISGEFTTIATIIEDSADLYKDTYLNETWIKTNFARHGGAWGFSCWRKVVEEAVFTGWNPLEMGLDKGCPTGYWL